MYVQCLAKYIYVYISCLYYQPIPDDTKQEIAAEMNLSETAFVRPLHAEEHLDTGEDQRASMARVSCVRSTAAILQRLLNFGMNNNRNRQ